MAALPVELPFDTVAFHRQDTAAERVPDELAVARDRLDRQPGQRAQVVRLSTSAGKKIVRSRATRRPSESTARTVASNSRR